MKFFAALGLSQFVLVESPSLDAESKSAFFKPWYWVLRIGPFGLSTFSYPFPKVNKMINVPLIITNINM